MEINLIYDRRVRQKYSINKIIYNLLFNIASDNLLDNITFYQLVYCKGGARLHLCIMDNKRLYMNSLIYNVQRKVKLYK